MFFDLLILFIILTILFLFISFFTMEDFPMISLPFCMIGMIFSILCTYGMWNIETLYIGYNASFGNTSAEIYSNQSYGDPYGYIFMFLFFVYILVFFRIGWNLWTEALETEGQMDYKKRGR